MAKWGEGDDRWLVQDRADGANVNSWHWVEKDCLEWSRQRLQELFNGMKLLDAGGDLAASTTGAKSLTGEAFLNTRKAKIIASYELELKVGWKGSTADGEEETGVAHFPYIAEENHDEEPEMRIICESETPLAQRLKQAILSQAKGKLQAAVGQYVQEMRAGKPVDAIADAQDGRKQAAASAAAAAAAEAPKPEPSSKAEKKPKPRGRTLELKQQFYASPADIYDCLLNANRIKAFTQSDAVVDARAGGEFSMFGGSITGKVLELEQNARIVQDWRFNSWEAGVVSRVEIALAAPVPGTTELTLKQTGIPEEDAFGNPDILPMVEAGWQQQIFLRIKAVFGYGV